MVIFEITHLIEVYQNNNNKLNVQSAEYYTSSLEQILKKWYYTKNDGYVQKQKEKVKFEQSIKTVLNTCSPIIVTHELRFHNPKDWKKLVYIMEDQPQSNPYFFNDQNKFKGYNVNHMVHIKHISQKHYDITDVSYSSRYYNICFLGAGSFGKVILIKDRKSGQVYAQKEIYDVTPSQAEQLFKIIQQNSSEQLKEQVVVVPSINDKNDHQNQNPVREAMLMQVHKGKFCKNHITDLHTIFIRKHWQSLEESLAPGLLQQQQ